MKYEIKIEFELNADINPKELLEELKNSFTKQIEEVVAREEIYNAMGSVLKLDK